MQYCFALKRKALCLLITTIDGYFQQQVCIPNLGKLLVELLVGMTNSVDHDSVGVGDEVWHFGVSSSLRLGSCL